MAIPGAPWGGYAVPTGPITQSIQNQIITEINKLKALIPDPSSGRSAVHTDFDIIDPVMAVKLRAEIDALIVKIDATPIS